MRLKEGLSERLTLIGHMSFEIDREDDREPSLLEMTKTALTSLENATKNTKRGRSSRSSTPSLSN